MINKCSQCGFCCRLFLINLTEEEYRSGKYNTEFEKFGLIPDFRKAAACGANFLKQKKDGSCIYLRANKCSIYKTRPQACKDFFCTSKSKKFKKMIELIEEKRASLGRRELVQYFIYILECSDKTFYVGCTNNLEKRLKEHNNSKWGAHYTKIRRPVILKYSEKFNTLLAARRREAEIKRWKRKKKEKLWL